MRDTRVRYATQQFASRTANSMFIAQKYAQRWLQRTHVNRTATRQQILDPNPVLLNRTQQQQRQFPTATAVNHSCAQHVHQKLPGPFIPVHRPQPRRALDLFT